MPGPNHVLDKGYLIQAAVNKFLPVKHGSANETATPATAGTDLIAGFIQETVSAADVTSGRVANVRVMGITRAIAGAAITRGADVMITTGGKVITATATNRIIGQAQFSVAADNDHVDVLLDLPGTIKA
jgi:hypothetical protein